MPMLNRDGIFMESYPLQLHADSVLVLEETTAPDENLDITTYTISETTISTDINSEITDVLETSNCLEASNSVQQKYRLVNPVLMMNLLARVVMF